MAAGLLPSSFSPFLFSSRFPTLTHSLFSHTHSHKTCLFYRQFLATFSSNSKGTIGPEIMPLIVALVMLPLSHNYWWGIATKWQYPNNHPLCHLCGQLFSCFFSTNLHSAVLPSFHFESVFNITFPFERINHARSGMIFLSLTPRLTTPPQTNIPKCDSH